MKIRSRHFENKIAADMSNSKNRMAQQTEIVETDSELTHYAHCRLPEHYFDMLLAKRQQRIPIPPPQLESGGTMHYR